MYHMCCSYVPTTWHAFFFYFLGGERAKRCKGEKAKVVFNGRRKGEGLELDSFVRGAYVLCIYITCTILPERIRHDLQSFWKRHAQSFDDSSSCSQYILRTYICTQYGCF